MEGHLRMSAKERKRLLVFDRLRDGQLDGIEPMTAFGKACEKLEIEIITANSPQAKGRVERSHGVYQDRFVKELKLNEITTVEGANKFLEGGFVDKLNVKFAQSPKDPQNYHRPVEKGLRLYEVFLFEEKRVPPRRDCTGAGVK